MAQANPLRADPTRSVILRKQFIGDIKRRLGALRRAITDLVVTQDAFGIAADEKAGQKAGIGTQAVTTRTLTSNERWRFVTEAEKVQGYQKWLKEQVDKGLLEVSGANQATPWIEPYIASSYKKGLIRAYTDSHAADLVSSKTKEDFAFQAGGKKQFLETAFNTPTAQNKIQLLSTRSFSQLKGITADMDKEMSRILAEGIASGKGPKKLAKELTDSISGLERKRALTIARTELSYAHAEGQLDSFEALGVDKLGVMAEWSTAGDSRVCDLCGPMEGVVVTPQEARGLIPRHANCRCAWIPAGVGEHNAGATAKTVWAGPQQTLSPPGTLPTGKTTGQIWSPTLVKRKLRESIKAELPKLDVADARKGSKWAGADLTSVTQKLKPGSAAAQAAKEAEQAAKLKEIARKAAQAEAATVQKAAALKAKLEAEQAAKIAQEIEAKKLADHNATLAGIKKWETTPGVGKDVLDKASYSHLEGWGPPPPGTKQSYGVVLFDEEGRVLLREPTGHYGQAHWTFAKGQVQGGPGTTAIAEVLEETGHHASIMDVIPGGFTGTTTKTNYFVGKSIGFDSAAMLANGETSATQWATLEEAKKLIAMSPSATVVQRDLKVLQAAYDVVRAADPANMKKLVATGASELATTEAAAKKAATAKKLSMASAKNYYAKPKFGGGIVDADFVDPIAKTKLDTTGVNKVLSGTGWHETTLPAGKFDEIMKAGDLVEQKAIIDKLPKAPKATPPPPPVSGPLAAGQIRRTPYGGWTENAKFTLDPSIRLGGSTGAKAVKVAYDTGGGHSTWVLKEYNGKSLQAQNEFIANKIYNALAPESAPLSRVGAIQNSNGGQSEAVFNRYITGGKEIGKLTGAELAAAQAAARELFVVDAWLANWDAVGLSGDNMLVVGGRVVRIDNGGALLFRAQGGLKGANFGPKVSELETLLDARLNPTAAELFKGIKKEQIVAQIDSLEKTINQSGGIDNFLRSKGINIISDPAQRKALEDTLAARFHNLLEIRDEMRGSGQVPMPLRRQRLKDFQTKKKNTEVHKTKDEANAALLGEASKLKPDELHNVVKYTKGYYQQINEEHLEAVRSGKAGSKTVKQIDAGLSKLPGFEGTLGRGHRYIDPKEWESFKRGDWSQVWWTCPSSSSASPYSVFGSNGNNGVCFIIRSKGKRNGYVQAISEHSGEHEALFMSDSSFRVRGWAQSDVKLGVSHTRFLVIDEMEVGTVLPESQAAPKKLDAKQLWDAFANDAQRAGMPSFGSVHGPSVSSLLDDVD